MVQFAKLRLTGFKSFVEPTEFEIAPGMTGIVGPNGCGKSNLLEALRWCMGESSARQMRGGGMDDVIFNGTTERPARNIAEVSLSLDNRDRTAPAAYNSIDEIEIVRAIERESGSSYRVNGRDVRAQDVKLLFADISSGPRSTAIVGQGRVGAIINAKPVERRLLLEEAAGITGLHSRRHEAELKLRAAEQNLARLDDVVITLQNQLQGLKRQARQASRYRNLSDHIRRAEALAYHLRWRQVEAELADSRARLAAIESEIQQLTSASAQAATALAEAGAVLPGLRHEEAAAAAERQRALVEQRAVEAETQRIVQQREDAERRLAQIVADHGRETALIGDADAALARLAEEHAGLVQAEADDADARRHATARAEEGAAAVVALEEVVADLMRKIAADEARRNELARRLREAELRLADLTRRIAETDKERAALEDAVRAADGSAESAALAEADTAYHRIQGDAEAAEQARATAEAEAAAARRLAEAANERLAQLRAEENGLRAVVETPAGEFPPVLDRIGVEQGYEPALGAALGDDLGASLQDGAPLQWRAGDGAATTLEFPAGTETLAKHVVGPPALDRRLAQIAVVEDEAAAQPLIGQLQQGQRLVTKTGALWRWDGLFKSASAPAPAAARLVQLNRMRELESERGDAQIAARAAELQAIEAQARSQIAFEKLRLLRENMRQALSSLNFAREQEARAQRAAADRNARLKALLETAERLAQEQADAADFLAAAEVERDAMSAPDAGKAALAHGQETLRARRAAHAEQMQIANRLIAEADARGRRTAAIADEQASWTSRKAGGELQRMALDERRVATEADIAQLAARPAELQLQRNALADLAQAAEARRQDAADRLALAETRQAEHDKALKQLEARLADARELRGRNEGAVAQAERGLGEITQRIADRLNCPPDGALALAEIKDGHEIPPQPDVERRLERLIHERETMGPVNLRAEEEADELEKQINTFESERADLMGAIERFRRAISDLNREGRERLLASFNDVNTHFEKLFTRLFGGGKAYLELVEGDDPLNAGLEVMASPPGKKLQSLSLLSGGEQALTALSLLFAVFLTNPAPVCILDEVDAPLDDANVDRFCNLVSDIAKDTGTRFLIVTHHRMTMARMNRLFGVTMTERGVSQLVSVDLEQAEAWREAA